MTYGPEKNEGLDKVFMTVIQPDGSFKAVEKLTRCRAIDDVARRLSRHWTSVGARGRAGVRPDCAQVRQARNGILLELVRDWGSL